MEDKIKTALNIQLQKVSNITNKNILDVWKMDLTNLIVSVYGENSQIIKQIESLKYYPGFSGGNNISQLKQKAILLIQGLIADFNTFGFPAHIDKDNFNININQNQTLNLSLDLKIFKESLNNQQFKELSTILKNNTGNKIEKENAIKTFLVNLGIEVSSTLFSKLLSAIILLP